MARHGAGEHRRRSLGAALAGALVAGVALVVLGLTDATPDPLSLLLDIPTRAVADQVADQAADQAAADLPHAADAAVTSPAPTSAVLPTPPAPVGPVPPPAPTLPTGPVLRVAKSGGDFATISAAAEQARPGDTVLISAGTYAETVDLPRDGTAGKPITFEAVPGQRVVIDGGGTRAAGDGLVNLNERSDITMIGITVRGSGSHGIFAEDARNIVLRDCEVADSQDGGIVFLDSSNVAVQRCDVHGNNARGTSASNEAVSFDHTDGFEVSFSTVRGNGEEGIDAKYDSTRGKVFDNIVDANRGPDIYIDSATGVDVFNNVVTGTTEESKAGISVAVEAEADTRRASDVDIYNNVVRGNAGGGIGFWIEAGGSFSDITIMNNTVVDNHGAGIVVDDGSFRGTNILRNNIFTGNAGGASEASGSFTADHNIFDRGGIGSLVTGAPSFVAPSNLVLATGSAGVGAGSTAGAPAFDIAGVARTGPVDVGAYQSADTLPPDVVEQVSGPVGDVLETISATVTAAVLGSPPS